MNIYRNGGRILTTLALVGLLTANSAAMVAKLNVGKLQASSQTLTPLQAEIERQRQRLSSAESEERRDALMRLSALRHPAAARAASSALGDAVPMVRATAAMSLHSLPPEESVANLLPLLGDKDEFVRQQVAYALGRVGHRRSTLPLIERLADKQDSVRGAAAFALGQIGDSAAVPVLAALLSSQPVLPDKSRSRKSKREMNPFVLRAAAHSLGEIRDRAAVPALIATLQDEQAEADVRREAAAALGALRDPAALPALRAALTAADPYLGQAAADAIRRVAKANGS